MLPTLRRGALATALSLGALSAMALPAQASHLRGGTLAIDVDGVAKATGTMLWYERADGDCAVGDTSGSWIDVLGPDAQSSGFSVDTEIFRCTPTAAYYRGTVSIDLADPGATWQGTPPPGRYTFRIQDCCRISDIVNLPDGDGDLSLEATARYVPGSTTHSPEMLRPVPLGFSIFSGYDADLDARDADGTTPLAVQLLQGADPSGSLFDDLAPADQRFSIVDGRVHMPAADAAGYTPGENVVYKARVTDGDGDRADHDVLVTATDNRPPAFGEGETELAIEPGSTHRIPVVVTDPNTGETVSLLTTNLPSWATLEEVVPGNPATAVLVLAPGADVTGTSTFALEAFDDNATGSLVVQRNYRVTVAVKPAPVVEQPAPVVTVPVPAPPAPKPTPFRVVSLQSVGSSAGGTLWFDVPGPGRLEAEALAVELPSSRKARAARTLKLFGRSKVVYQAGRVGVDVRLNRASMKLLAKHGLMRVVVSARFIPVEGPTVSTKKTLKFKRFSMLFLRDAKLTADGKGLRAIVRVPYAGRLRATVVAEHDGGRYVLGRAAVRSVARGERDLQVRFTNEDAAHLLGEGTTALRVTAVLTRPGQGSQRRTRSFTLASLAR